MTTIRVIRIASLALAVAVASPSAATAQATASSGSQIRVVDSTTIQVMTLRDGSTLVGRVVSVRGDTVDFQGGIGRVAIAIGQIRDVKEVKSARVHDGEYWFPNPNATRLFFAPTGQMLKKGEGYFADYELFFPGFAYGVTDNFSLGGGVSIFPTGIDEQVYYFTPKIGMSFSDQIHVAAGLLLAGTTGGEGTGGVLYGAGTFGDGDASLTIGVGYGFAGGDIATKPALLVGGEKRISRRIALVTENYLLPTDDAEIVYSLGLRFMGEKLTTDLGLFRLLDQGDNNDFLGLPFVDFVFKF
jgi:hypothetical protein